MMQVNRVVFIGVLLVLMCMSVYGAIVTDSQGSISTEFTSGSFVINFYDDDDLPPVILNQTVVTGSSSATVTVTFNESANMTIDYGTTTALGSVVSTSVFQNPNSLVIGSLSSSTTYYYNVTACDTPFGNCNETGPFSFTTDAAGSTPECSDGVDNDGDSLIDFPNDPDCTDGSDNSETASSSPSGSGGGTSSLGGGGGGSLGNGTKQIAAGFSRFWDEIGPGTVEFFINKDEIAFTRIEMELESKVTGATVGITRLNSFPSGVSPISILYQLFEIETINIGSSDIDKVTFYFRVDKDWLEASSIPIESVRLNRYRGGEWRAESTTYVGDMGDAYLFSAVTTGFSYFAITGTSNKPAPVVSEPGTTPTQPSQPDAPTPTGQVVSDPDSESPIVELFDEEANFFAAYGLWLLLLALPLVAYLSFKTVRGVQAKGIKTLTAKYYTDTTPDEYMRMQNGWILRNIYDLYNAINQVNDAVFMAHKNANQFSKWVGATFEDPVFAKEMAQANSKAHMAQLVYDKIQFLHREQHDHSVSQKYGVTQDSYSRLLKYVHNAKGRGLTNEQIYSELVRATWDKRLIEETLYGIIHSIHKLPKAPAHMTPKARASINRYIMYAVNTGHTRERIRQDLLKAKWPLSAIQQELSGFMTKDSKVSDYLKKR